MNYQTTDSKTVIAAQPSTLTSDNYYGGLFSLFDDDQVIKTTKIVAVAGVGLVGIYLILKIIGPMSNAAANSLYGIKNLRNAFHDFKNHP